MMLDVRWKFFVGASILTCGLLLKSGAPWPAVAVGVAMAAFLTWRIQRRSSR
jgi:hypothetical protein